MARYAVINGGTVINVIEAEEGFTIPGHSLVASDTASSGWIWNGETLSPPPFDLAGAQAALMDEITEIRDSLLAAGVEVAGGLHVSLTDGSRTDLGGMGTAAIAALSNLLPWPDDYAQGWITIENTRVPLPTPADGIALAAAAGARYAALVQWARTRKDDVLAAQSEADIAAIDVTAGWPT